MDNTRRCVDSDFPASRVGYRTIPESLKNAIKTGADPFRAWAEHMAASPETMAQIFQCSPEVYKFHISGFGNGASKPIFSPLTEVHVLNFCYHTGIHPAELASFSSKPEEACPPNIYRAMHNLCMSAPHQLDRTTAAVGLRLEEERYQEFLALYPDVAIIFREIQNFADSRLAETRLQTDVTGEVSSIGNKALKWVLLKAFTDSTTDIHLTDPAFHIEDFHSLQHDKLGAAQDALKVSERNDRENKQNIKLVVGALFGKDTVPQVLTAVENLLNFLSKETEVPREDYPVRVRDHLMQKFPVNGDTVEELKKSGIYIGTHVSVIVKNMADGLCAYYTQTAETKAHQQKLQTAKLEMDYFDRWFKKVQDPEFHFMHYLYNNNAVASMPVHRTPVLSYEPRRDIT